MKKWFRRKAAPALAASIVHALAATLRIGIEDPFGALQTHAATPAIFTFWHNRLLLMPKFYQFFYPKRSAAALISRSRDGEIIADICAQFGVIAIRGSSSKQATIAFRELVRNMETGRLDIVITPDGPRGPRYHAQLGALQLSQMTGFPVIPVTYYLSHKWVMKSWDQFQIPKPFSRCHLVFAQPFVVPTEAEDLQPYASRLTRGMGGDEAADELRIEC